MKESPTYLRTAFTRSSDLGPTLEASYAPCPAPWFGPKSRMSAAHVQDISESSESVSESTSASLYWPTTVSIGGARYGDHSLGFSKWEGGDHSWSWLCMSRLGWSPKGWDHLCSLCSWGWSIIEYMYGRCVYRWGISSGGGGGGGRHRAQVQASNTSSLPLVRKIVVPCILPFS